MDPSSPRSGSETEKMSPSDFAGSPQSEQLPYFKDYYSSDDIHPGDRVSTLWAYAPRAPDEFELERGDMIKVVGIWDDGRCLDGFSPRLFANPLRLGHRNPSFRTS
jgi:hypothetical protein